MALYGLASGFSVWELMEFRREIVGYGTRNGTNLHAFLLTPQ